MNRTSTQKKIRVFIIVMLLACTPAIAQNYTPFPDVDAVWCGDRGYLDPGPISFQWLSWDYQIHIEGDTTINGVVYHKLYDSGIASWESVPIPTTWGSQPYYNEYQGCFRESAKKIWFIPASETAEQLLYDFDIGLNSQLPSTYNCYSQLVVTSIDSVFDGSMYRTKYNLSHPDTSSWPMNFEYVSIIEGIGSTHGLLWTMEPYFENEGALNAFRLSGNVIYPDSNTVCEVTGLSEPANQNISLMAPNPANEQVRIAFGNHSFGLMCEIYDTNGSKILSKPISESWLYVDTSALPNGIYFIRTGSVTQKLIVLHPVNQ